MKEVTIIGLDIAKSVFEVCSQDDGGNVVERRQLVRGHVLGWFAQRPPCRVGIEACGGSHYWAREITRLGHQVRIIPPQYVKPYVRTNKSDAHDAQAIGRALREPDMPSVAIATVPEQDVQALHRVRSRLIAERTALINQLRGLLGEYGIVLPKRIEQARKGFTKLLENPPEALSLMFRDLLRDHNQELHQKDEKIDRYTTQIEQQVEADPAGQRVRKILGIGPLTASALVIKVRHGSAYQNGRHFSASLGLIPRHAGTGGKVTIKGLSKRGDRYLRGLLIHGARAVIAHVKHKKDPLSLWIKNLIDRRGKNKAVVALANKHARIAWRLIAKNETYDAKRACGLQATAA